MKIEHEDETLVYANGEECNHPGCAHHATHPCEGCGRYLAVGEVWLPTDLIHAWELQN